MCIRDRGGDLMGDFFKVGYDTVSDILCRTVRKRVSQFVFKGNQLIIFSIPFLVAHDLSVFCVIDSGSFIEFLC